MTRRSVLGGAAAALALVLLTAAYVPGEPAPRPNLLVNPSFDIDQPNESGSYTGCGGTFAAMDGWRYSCTTSATGITLARSAASPPGGFANTGLLTIGTGNATVNSGDLVALYQRVEANNFTGAAFGTGSAAGLAIRFWQKCSVGGTYAVALSNEAQTRSWFQTYALTAGTWSEQLLEVPGDTGGSWVGSGAASALKLWFVFAAGSASQGTAGAWSGSFAVTGAAQTQLSQTTGATCAVTGVKLEIAPGPTPFVRLAFAEELLRAQRYYQKSYSQGIAPGTPTTSGAEIWSEQSSSTIQPLVGIHLKQPMRCSPSITLYSARGTGASGKWYESTSGGDIAASASNADDSIFFAGPNSAFANSVGGFLQGHWTADCRL